MSKVAFKRGRLANLPQTYSEGTFYITEDEKAVYLDIDDSTRIKLSNYQIPAATEDTLGAVRLNLNEGISLDEDGKMLVEGRLGHMTNSSGIYAPKTISPAAVGSGSMLVTEANGTKLGSKSMSVTTGMNLSLKGSHAQGSTSYSVANNYANRILCYLAIGGMACFNEANAANTVKITSVTIGGSSFTPSSAADSSTNIIITTEKSANPNSATNNIRIYPSQQGFSNLLGGVAGSKDGFGYSMIAGQCVYNGSNASGVFGNTQYNVGNSSLLAGRQHINTQMDAFLAGTGHDTSNASRYVSAVGRWSSLSNKTLFAVGNGTNHLQRSNAFEVIADGIVLHSPNGNRWKVSVDDSGNLNTAAL